jgi:hypothetical protein
MMEKKKRVVIIKKALGPGVHTGLLELKSGGSYRVLLRGGAHARATLDVTIPEWFADECLKAGKRILLEDGEHGPVIIGAIELPTERGSEKQRVDVKAKDVRFRADDTFTIEVGACRFVLDKSGAVRLESRNLVLDAASLVRVLSSRVELP